MPSLHLDGLEGTHFQGVALLHKWINHKGIFIEVELTCETLGAY